MVIKDLDELSSGTEQQHRPELRIDAASDDQLVGVLCVNHALHRNSVERGRPRAGCYMITYGVERETYCGRVVQIQLNATHICLVRYSARVQLQDDGITDLFGKRDGLIGIGSDKSFHDRNARASENLFRF